MSTQQKHPLTLQLEAEAVEIFHNISDADKENLELLVSSLDTNVVVSSLLFSQSTPRQSFNKALDTGKILISLILDGLKLKKGKSRSVVNRSFPNS